MMKRYYTGHSFLGLSLAVALVATLVLLPAAGSGGQPGQSGASASPVSLSGYTANECVTSPVDAGLSVKFSESNGYPNILWSAPSKAGWNWSGYTALVFTLKNPAAADLSFAVRIDTTDGNGKAEILQESAVVAAGQSQNFFFSFSKKIDAKQTGMQGAPPIDVAEFGALMGRVTDLEHVQSYQIFLSQPKAPAALIVKSIALSNVSTDPNFGLLVDRYGQYTRADWPRKVHSDADFAMQLKAERQDLQAHRAPSARDRWGGWISGPKQDATGYFHTAQLKKRWWLVDPDGYLFLSVGVDCVGQTCMTQVGGRENMFCWLPEAGAPLMAFNANWGGANGRVFDFGAANYYRKYGADWRDAEGASSLFRLRSWGFNTMGNWSDEALGRRNHFPYVVALGGDGGATPVTSGGQWGGKVPDPFDPIFVAAVDANFSKAAAVVGNDPACIGYFYDNEIPWGDGNTDDGHYGLAYSALALPAHAPAKVAFLGFLKNRYDTIEHLNVAWGTSFSSFDALSQPYKTSLPLKTALQRVDYSDFLSVYAEQYYRIVSAAVRKHDPHHMYLGSRLALFTPEVVKACAKYVDVMSFNIYDWQPGRYQYAEQMGKPLLVGEFHFGALDRGMFSGGMRLVKNQSDRAAHYSETVKAFLSEPAFVGCHWFQYNDEPTTGRPGDGENFNIGFVSATDTPYPELIDAARATNAHMYQIHAVSKLSLKK